MLPAAAPAILAQVCALLPLYWPTMPLPSALGAQIEQETCISLTHSKCFSPRAELKTQREYGFGLGQITITPAFNNFEVVKRMQPALKDWAWDNRYDTASQLIALLSMDRNEYNACAPLMLDSFNALACMAARYNGGAGGFNADRRLCSNTQGCDPKRWFGHVELYSTKAKVAASGYGKSFYQINREYVRNVMYTRRAKYDAAIPCVGAKP